MKIRTRIDRLFEKRHQLSVQITDIQNECPHEVSVYEARGSSGNWDNESYYWYNFYCYDCRKRWSTEQSLGHGNSLKVDTINDKETPEVIELMIKMERTKR